MQTLVQTVAFGGNMLLVSVSAETNRNMKVKVLIDFNFFLPGL